MNLGEWSWSAMAADILKPSNNLLEVVLRCLVVYLFLIVGLRLAGKRQMGQMTITDLVLILVISNAVQNAMIGPDNSLTGGLVAATSLLVLNAIATRLQRRSSNLRRLIMGSPSLLVHDGAFVTAHMEAENISSQQVMAALREHGIDELDHVKSAVLEIDGSISVIASDQPLTHKPHRVRYLRHA